MSKAIVGMSGGVDSAVAALLLKQSGYEVAGVTLRVWQSEDGTEGRCCDIEDARRVAFKLGIPYCPINCISDFRRYVIEPCVNAYVSGYTPNPCVECNRFVKWEKLLHFAKVFGAEYIATGHYASVVKLDNGRYTVKKALFAEKDQTYMLYKLSQEQLASTLMPLGSFSKSEVRRMAREAGLPSAEKQDSQEICFITEGNYTDYIEKNAGHDSLGEGNFIDEKGAVLGRHKGIVHYTLGQRKGLGLSLGFPAYVKEIRAGSNEVVIGGESSLYSRELICGNVNYLSCAEPAIGKRLACSVKVRYRHCGQPAIIESIGGNRVKISFEEPVKAASPGQSAVFYDDFGCVVGGGTITGILK